MWIYVYIYIYIYIHIYTHTQLNLQSHIYAYTGCLKIEATSQYDNDLLLSQAQWWLFGTYPVKYASFELETSNQSF